MAVDNFTMTMQKAQAQLESLRRAADEHMSTYITVSVLDAGVANDLDGISNQVNMLRMQGDVDIIAKFRNDGLWDAIEEFEFFKSERPKSKTVVTKFTTRAKDVKDIEKLQATMKSLRDEADEFGKLSVGIKGLDELSDVNTEMKAFNKNIKGVKSNLKKPLIAKIATEGLEDATKGFAVFRKIAREVKQSMNKMANTMRTFGELFQHSFISGFLMLAPIAVPAIASVAGALGALLPIIGTAGGGVMAMATSFGLAGAGAVAFGALAKSALGDIFGVSEDLSKLNDKLAKAKDDKERAKILEEIAHAQDGLTSEQKEGLKSLQALKGEWNKISKALQPEVIDTFTLSMGGLQSVLKNIEPMFGRVSKHAQNLVEWLNAQIDTADVQAFYKMLNSTAGPSLERVGKAMSNFGIGLGNLMVAFAPAAVDFEKGFLRMSESFRDWTAGLSESKKFQKFISYVKENGPKLLEIIGNIVGGLVGMGIAFAPFAEKMLDGLVEMTQKFQDWGDELKNNKGFQNFIKYVQENGPKFLDFLREFRDMLINIGVAFAPLGEKIMDFVTELMKAGNEFFESNRGAGELLATLGWLGSVIAFLYPIITILWGVLKNLGGVLKTVWGWVKKLKPVWDLLVNALKIAGPWILRTLGFLMRFVNPITAIIVSVIALGYTIYKNWDDIKTWTKDMVFAIVKQFAKWKLKAEAAVNGIKAAFNVFDQIDLLESGKKIIGSLIDGIASMAGSVGTAISKVVGPGLRDYLPFSPAKKGPLKDLDKLNFGGPIIDSIRGDGPRIARAMNSMLSMPTVSDGGYSMGSAKAGLLNRGTTAQGNTSANAASSEYYFEVPVIVDGREVARATAKFTQEELDRMKRDKNRASGRVSLA